MQWNKTRVTIVITYTWTTILLVIGAIEHGPGLFSILVSIFSRLGIFAGLLLLTVAALFGGIVIYICIYLTVEAWRKSVKEVETQ